MSERMDTTKCCVDDACGYEARLPNVTHPVFGVGSPSYHDLAHLYEQAERVLADSELSRKVTEEGALQAKDQLSAIRATLACTICGGIPPSSGLPCICKGTNKIHVEVQELLATLARVEGERDEALKGGEGFWGRATGRLLVKNKALTTERDGLKEIIECIALVTAYEEKLPGTLVGHVKVLVGDLLKERDGLARERDALKAMVQEGTNAMKERDRLLDSAAQKDAYCLAHSHANRVEEAICSLRFQRDGLLKKVEELEEFAEECSQDSLEAFKEMVKRGVERDGLREEVARLTEERNMLRDPERFNEAALADTVREQREMIDGLRAALDRARDALVHMKNLVIARVWHVTRLGLDRDQESESIADDCAAIIERAALGRTASEKQK